MTKKKIKRGNNGETGRIGLDFGKLFPWPFKNIGFGELNIGRSTFGNFNNKSEQKKTLKKEKANTKNKLHFTKPL